MDVKMFLGKPILTSVGKVFPLTLDEIDDLAEGEMGVSGVEKYNSLLGLLTFHVGDLDLEVDISEMTTFQVIASYCVHSEEHRVMTEQALSLFFKKPVVFNTTYHVFVVENDFEKVIHQDNYEEIKKVLIKQNCLRDEQEFNPQDDKAKDFIRKLKKMRQKYSKVINNGSGKLSDVVSAVCAKHNTISPFNVGKLTIYTIFNQFKRLNAVDNYFLSVEMIMQGGKKQDVNLKHWSDPIAN